MEKLDPSKNGRSPDFVAENLEKLRELFPQAFTGERVDLDALRQLLGDRVDDEAERYGLRWPGKARARQLALTPTSGTLRPMPAESVQWDTTRNLFVEGENLEVLKLLQRSFHRKVRLVAIDPPYNTGREFVYPDRFQDHLAAYLRATRQVDEAGLKLGPNTETAGRYHTNWLNMMYPRLVLARSLLRQDGLIAVCIDDNEVHNLRHLLDEIFGAENFVANLVWQKAYVANITARFVSATHDHVLVYARDAALATVGRVPRTAEQVASFDNPDDDPRGPWKPENLSAGKYYSAGRYTITTPSGAVVSPPPGRYWRCNEARYREWLADGRIWFGKDGSGRPMLKKFLSEVQEGLTPDTWWRHELAGTNKQATSELKALFGGEQVFDTPKPVALLERIVGLFGAPDGIVLDFFAGSGATGHAVMKLNAQDGGQRRFVLVQLPERTDSARFPTIAHVTRARLQAAARQLAGGRATDLGFRAFKLDSSNIKPWTAAERGLDAGLFDALDVIEPDRNEEDVLFEILLKVGLDPALPVARHAIAGRSVLVAGKGALVACLTEEVDLALVQGIAALSPTVQRVVFRDAAFPDDVVKTNALRVLRAAGIDDVKSL